MLGPLLKVGKELGIQIGKKIGKELAKKATKEAAKKIAAELATQGGALLLSKGVEKLFADKSVSTQGKLEQLKKWRDSGDIN